MKAVISIDGKEIGRIEIQEGALETHWELSGLTIAQILGPYLVNEIKKQTNMRL